MTYRILRIPLGQEKDAEGREVGSDWLIADCGLDSEDDCHYYVTSDRVRASASVCLATPRETAEALLQALETANAR